MNDNSRWDAIVVGGGVAGCAVAGRLVDDGRRVLVLEAGPGEPRPATVDGIDTVAASDEPSRLWPGLTVQAGIDTEPRPYRQGFGLGGGSLVNSLLQSAGDRIDYERWERELACPGWGPDDMKPWLDRAARAIPGRTLDPGPVTSAFERAASDRGHPAGGTSMDDGLLGTVAAHLAIDGRRRRSAFDAYLQPHLATGSIGRSRLSVRSGAQVEHIVVTRGRATGIRLTSGEEVAAPLVVSCAGAIGSPRLLARSGLGPSKARHVLKDHASFVFTLALKPEMAADTAGSDGPGSRAITRILRWSSGLAGPGDLQAFVVDRVDGANPMAIVVVGLMAVSSVGELRWDEDSTDVPATVISGALATTDDRRRFRVGVDHTMELLRSPAMTDLIDEVFIDDRGTPAERLMSMGDDAVADWLRTHPGPIAHPAASCAMGPAHRPGAVVGAEPGRYGRLHGTDGVVVADASVMPDLVRGGLQIPVAAVAERIADDLVAES